MEYTDSINDTLKPFMEYSDSINSTLKSIKESIDRVNTTYKSIETSSEDCADNINVGNIIYEHVNKAIGIDDKDKNKECQTKCTEKAYYIDRYILTIFYDFLYNNYVINCSFQDFFNYISGADVKDLIDSDYVKKNRSKCKLLYSFNIIGICVNGNKMDKKEWHNDIANSIGMESKDLRSNTSHIDDKFKSSLNKILKKIEE